jgi:RecB family exonuclease
VTVETRWVRYGEDAAQALRAEIVEAKGSEPLAPVTVVVPSNHVGVAARRLLASGDLGPTTNAADSVGLVAVTFLTTYRLAELFGAPVLAGQGRRPVSTPVITAAVRSALERDAGMFDAVKAHPATELALGATYRELRDLDAAALDRLSGTGERCADVVRIHRAARRFLADGWYDEEDLIEAAVEGVLTKRPADVGTVVVYLPQRLSRHAALLVRALGEHGPVVVIAGSTGVGRADAEVVTSVSRMQDKGPAPSLFGDGPPEDPAALAGIVGVDRTMVLTASDADEEVREAVRSVVDAARQGTPLDRIAVLYASPQPYDRLVREHLTEAGVATNGSATTPVSARMAGRVLLDLLDLPALDFRRDEVFAWLSSARLLDDGRWAPVAAWERASRQAGVVGGREQWDRLLAGLVDRWTAEAAALSADPDEPEARAEHVRQDAQRAASLRSFVLRLIDDLAAAASTDRPWGQWADWARSHLETLLGRERERRAWPVPEQRAAERVELALDRLSALDDLEGPVPLAVFTRTLRSELEVDLGRVGRLGEGVLIGSVAMGVGLGLDLVVLLGLAEGSFPAAVRDDSLVPDADREASGSDLPRRGDRVERQHRELLATLAGAGRQVLSVPRGDLRQSRDRVASRWLLDVVEELAGRRIWTDELWKLDEPGWLRHRASFDAGLRAIGTLPATAQEHRLITTLAADPDRDGLAAVARSIDPVMAVGVEVLDARRSRSFTRFDGHVTGVGLPSPVDRGASATSLERWVDCPFAYFMQRPLGIDPVELPEDELTLTHLDRGSLVHLVLERFLDEVMADAASTVLTTYGRWSVDDRARLARIGGDVCDEYERAGRTGRPFFWRRERPRLLAQLQEFATADDEQRSARRARPVATELPFGLDGRPKVPMSLPDSRALPFRGKADRIDVTEDGTIIVLDYKTGKAAKTKKLSEADPDLGGTKLQLAVYGQAARAHLGDPEAPVEAYYWYVTTDAHFVRHGYPVTPEVLDLVGQNLGRIVDGIEHGVFVPHPEPTQAWYWKRCEYCDPDGLGTVELRRQWDRKAADPVLADYVDLVEPEVTAP